MQNTKYSTQIMIIKSMKSILFLAILFVFLITIQTNDTLQHNITKNKTTFSEKYPNVTLDQQIDQNQLRDLQSQNNKEQFQQLNPWLAQELKNSKTFKDLEKAESFIIHLDPDQTYEFQWDLSYPQSKKRSYELFLNVFTHQGGKDITFVHDPQQNSFTTVEIKNSMHDAYTQMGKVYMTRKFTVFFQQRVQAKILKFTNLNSFPILLQINMEVQANHLQMLKDSIALNKHFQIAARKLNTVFQEVKQTDKTRTQSYKWQWGFLERQQRYQDEMLRLTGVQLFAIIVTAIVQMYCLKGLLQNKQIV